MRSHARIALLLPAILLAACAPKGPDPFLVYEAALQEAREAKLPSDWKAQTAIFFGTDLVEQSFARAADLMLAKLPSDTSVQWMATRVELELGLTRTGTSLVVSDVCASCIGARIELKGESSVTISNPTGTMHRKLPWTGALKALYRLHARKDARGDVVILVAPAESEHWELDIHFESVGERFQPLIMAPVRDKLRELVSKGTLFSLPLARVEHDGVLPLKAIRVRSEDGVISVEQAFGVVGAVPLEELPPIPEEGWVAEASAQTLLAFLKAALYEQRAPAEGRVEAMDLHLQHEGFLVHLRLHPNRWPRRPIEIGVRGTIDLREDGSISFHATKVEPLKGRLMDPVAFLMRARIESLIEDALSATLPISTGRSFGPARAVLKVTQIEAREEHLRVFGSLEIVGKDADVGEGLGGETRRQ